LQQTLDARAKMKIELVKKCAAKLSKLFSSGPPDFATINPPYASPNLDYKVISNADTVSRRSCGKFFEAG
jgi:hypothetical protein